MTVSARRRKGYAHSLTARHHTLIADEPETAGGADTGPTPQELLALSLASCTAITSRCMPSARAGTSATLEVEVDYELGREGRPVALRRGRSRCPQTLSDEQLERLRVIAGKCPVHRALAGEVEISDRVERL